VKIHKNKRESAKAESIFKKGAKEKQRRSPPTQLPGPRHHRGGSPGPAQSPPEQGGGERGQPGCACTLGGPTPLAPPLGPTSLWRCNQSWWWSVLVVSIFSKAKLSLYHYIRKARALLSNTHHLELHTLPLYLYSLALVLV
jgi:hypothetical protein